MKSGQASLRTKRTRFGATICTSFTLSLSSLAPLPLYLSNVNFTSSAVTGSPLWNLVPLRRRNSYVRPSLETVHDSARLGGLSPPGMGLTRAPGLADRGMKRGVDASGWPGSSQRETSVTWTPMVSVPSLAAGAGDAPARMPKATTAATSERRASISGPPVGAVSGTELSSRCRRGYHNDRSRTRTNGGHHSRIAEGERDEEHPDRGRDLPGLPHCAPGRGRHGRCRGPGQAGRGDALGHVRDAGARLARSRRVRHRCPHAVLDSLCHPRCAREAHAGQSSNPEPGRVVDREPGRQDVRVQAAGRAQVP